MKQLQRLQKLMEAGKSVQWITLLEAPAAAREEVGKVLLIEPDGTGDGILVDTAFTGAVIKELQVRTWNAPCSFSLSYENEEYRLFWNWLGKERYRAVILGGGHISQPLAQILAMLDFEVLVVDDRREFANKLRFPWAQEVICSDFTQALPDLELDEKTAVFIVTRGHRHDLECLQEVLGSKAGYIGMIGSHRKVRGAFTALEEAGFARESLEQVYAPIGLDIGGQSPAEIAVSIAAEVVAVFRKGSCVSMRDKERKQHG